MAILINLKKWWFISSVGKPTFSPFLGHSKICTLWCQKKLLLFFSAYTLVNSYKTSVSKPKDSDYYRILFIMIIQSAKTI